MPWIAGAIAGTGLLSYMSSRDATNQMKNQAGFQNMLAMKYLEASEEERKRFRELYGPIEKHLTGLALKYLKGDFSSGPYARTIESINPAFERNNLAIKRNFAATGRPDSGLQHKLLSKNELRRTGAHIKARRDAQIEGRNFAQNLLVGGRGIKDRALNALNSASGAGYRGGTLMSDALGYQRSGEDALLGMGLDALRLWGGGSGGGGTGSDYTDKQKRIDSAQKRYINDPSYY